MAGVLLLLAALVAVCSSQNLFELPNLNRPVHKPKVPAEYANYFDLSGSAKTFVNNLLGRPGRNSLVPDPSFEVAGSQPAAPSGASGMAIF